MHTIRVPVAEAATAEGRAVLDHYLSQISEDHEHYARRRDPDHFDAVESNPGSASEIARTRDFLLYGLSAALSGLFLAFIGSAAQGRPALDRESEILIWVMVHGGGAAAVAGAIAIAIGLFLATRR